MRYSHTYETEPTISLEQVLWFITYYGDINEIDYKGFIFEDGIEFKRTFHQDYFESLMLLHLENVIYLGFHGQTKNEFGRKNKELEKTLKQYQDKDAFGKAMFDLTSFHFDWDVIKNQIKQYDCFGYEIKVNGRRFLELMFCKISQEMGYLDMDRESIVKKLYQYITDSTNGKHNYNDEIVLSYRFDDYLKSRRLILPLLIEMRELGRLKISNISIKNDYIIFSIRNIIDISEEELIKVVNQIPGKFYMNGESKKIEKIEYTQEGIMINDQKWKPKDSQKTEDFLKLVSMYFYENPKIKYIHINTIQEFYTKKKKLINSELTLNEKNIKNSYMKTFKEKLSDDFTGTFLQMSRGVIQAKEDFQDTVK